MEEIAPNRAPVVRAVIFTGSLVLVGAFFLALAVTTTAGRPTAEDLLYAFATLGLGWLGLVLMVLSIRNGRLLVGMRAIGRQDLLGRRRIWTADEIGTVVDATVLIAGRKKQARRYIFFLGLDGRRLLVLNAITWSQSAIDRLVQASGKVPQIRTGAIAPKDLRKEFPGTFGPMTANPYIVIVPVFVVVLVIAIVVSFGPTLGR